MAKDSALNLKEDGFSQMIISNDYQSGWKCVVDKVRSNKAKDIMTVTGSMTSGETRDGNGSLIRHPEFKIVFKNRDHEKAKGIITEYVKKAIADEKCEAEWAIDNAVEKNFSIIPTLEWPKKFEDMEYDDWNKFHIKMVDAYNSGKHFDFLDEFMYLYAFQFLMDERAKVMREEKKKKTE